MPEEKPQNPNGKTPKLNLPDQLHFDRSPFRCKRCKRVFDERLIVEEIEELVQLRIGSALLVKAEIACAYCGCVHYWDMSKKIIEGVATVYGELLKRSGYNPE